MKIVMMTNTYKPMMGGLERSVESFASRYRLMGHPTVIVAPEFAGMPAAEKDVVRLPSWRNVNGTDFSVNWPVEGRLRRLFEDEFVPDIVHAHHPFLIGDMALRLCGHGQIPLVFTYHTLYDQYTQYLPVDNQAAKQFVRSLSAGYANLVNQVIAPSQSVKDLLVSDGVKTPIEVIPTGVEDVFFEKADQGTFRGRHGISPGAFVFGSASRIAPEKNVGCLMKAAARVLRRIPGSVFMMVGDGSSKAGMEAYFERVRLKDRVVFLGALGGGDLIDAYQAMDAFVFASVSETQGMVVSEAMAGGVPVIAVDGPGVRDIVESGRNGMLAASNRPEVLAEKVVEFERMDPPKKSSWKDGARKSAENVSMDRMSRKALKLYEAVYARKKAAPRNLIEKEWEEWKNRIQTEWSLLKNIGAAAQDALFPVVLETDEPAPDKAKV
ncbi:MAG: glycosyltransferase [Candidatus Omnitrophica bacterium]|nr:glycosyltransferase [Candidatus Omnitrophota bacterium]